MGSALALAAALAIAGCTSQQERDARAVRPLPVSPNVQPGMQVLMAAGLTAGGFDHAANAIWATGNAIDPPPGIGTGLAVGMSALGLLMEPSDPLYSGQVIAWIPRKPGETAGAARARWNAMVEKALRAAVAETLPENLRVVPPPKQVVNPGRLRIVGGNCDTLKIVCGYKAHAYSDPLPGTAPKFLGGGSVWVWPNRIREGKGASAAWLNPSAVDQREWLARYQPWLPDVQIYRELSKRLPDWAYVYLAPRVTSLGPGKGFIQKPLMFHRGEEVPIATSR